jgi:tRNA (guanine-N7-)-methyltransferase
MISASGLKKRVNLVHEVGKNKIARWAELGTFNNVIQPETKDVSGADHSIKGNWRTRIFRNSNPVVLELGCGKGEYTLGLAEIFPGMNFIGIDIKGARMWRGAKTADANRMGNVAFLRTRIEFIDSFFAEDEVDEIWIIFPDPYPGKKNSNKRLTCPWFLNKYRTLVKENGIIHLKTDNPDMYRYTENLVRHNGFDILMSTNDLYGNDNSGRPSFHDFLSSLNIPGENTDSANRILSIRTFYEKMFLKEGLKINYLAFRLDKNRKVYEKWEKTE